MNQDG